jgi:hypothetical protein
VRLRATNGTIRIMNMLFNDIQCRAAVVKLSERRAVIRASTRQLRYSHKRSLLHAPRPAAHQIFNGRAIPSLL